MERSLILEWRFGGVASLKREFVEKAMGVGFLRDRDGTCWVRTMNVDSEELSGGTEVTNSELFGEALVDKVDFFERFGENEDIVNVNCNNDKRRGE